MTSYEVAPDTDKGYKIMKKLIISQTNDHIEVKDFSEGLAAIGVKNRWGFINENWEIIIEPQYVAVSRFYMGVALVRKHEGSWFLIDKKGNIVPNELAPGHFVTVEEEERDPDRLYIYHRFVYNSGRVITYDEDTYSYSGRCSDEGYGYIG